MKVHLKHGKVTQIMLGASRNYRYVSDVSDIPHDPIPVNDSFPNEQLVVIKVQSHSDPWFADYANFIVAKFCLQV